MPAYDGLIRRDRAQLLLVDVQEKLAPAMYEMTAAAKAMRMLVETARTLAIPLTVAEHHPRGLGRTFPELRAATGDATAFEKTTFSCAAHAPLRDAVHTIARDGRDRLVIIGLETHVCVLQSAMDFLAQGLRPFVAIDATTARAPHSIAVARDRLLRTGVGVVTAEMVFFEWIGDAAAPEFAALRHLVR